MKTNETIPSTSNAHIYSTPVTVLMLVSMAGSNNLNMTPYHRFVRAMKKRSGTVKMTPRDRPHMRWNHCRNGVRIKGAIRTDSTNTFKHTTRQRPRDSETPRHTCTRACRENGRAGGRQRRIHTATFMGQQQGRRQNHSDMAAVAAPRRTGWMQRAQRRRRQRAVGARGGKGHIQHGPAEDSSQGHVR